MTLSSTLSSRRSISPICSALLYGALSVCTLSTSEARSPSWGAGLMIGWPSGLAVQVPLSRSSAFNGSLYYDLRGPSFDVHLDNIFLVSRPIFEHLYPYIGWGGYLTARSSSHDHDHAATHHHTQERFDISARLPIGVEVGRHNLRGFFELAPTLSLIPAIQVSIGGSFGVRYHF